MMKEIRHEDLTLKAPITKMSEYGIKSEEYHKFLITVYGNFAKPFIDWTKNTQLDTSEIIPSNFTKLMTLIKQFEKTGASLSEVLQAAHAPKSSSLYGMSAEVRADIEKHLQGLSFENIQSDTKRNKDSILELREKLSATNTSQVSKNTP